jgi:tRNA (guanine-N7-)-methyltransferase
MGKNKLLHFEENKTFPNFFQPDFEAIRNGFRLKGRWNRDFFGNDKPIILELGCGKGEYCVGLATKYPDRNFIGIDRKGARMWRGAKTSQEKEMMNIAFLRIRIEQLAYCFADNEISEIWITFPDPQPKKRKFRKRLTSLRFLTMYHKLLLHGGLLHLKTDNNDFYKFTLEEIDQIGAEIIMKTTNLYHSELDGDMKEIQTYYEKRFLEKGCKINYLCCRFT